MSEDFRGIFPVLETPFRNDGSVDPETLAREVEFSVTAGAHGLVYPVLGSEFQYLADDERHQMVETVIKTAAKRIPVVTGVAATSAPAALAHARHAADHGADAVVALPPFPGSPALDEVESYYRMIASAGLPVFIQHTDPGMNPAFLGRIMTEIEHVDYIKEESEPSAHQISAVIEQAGEHCKGVFAGAHGRWMLSELDRGASGFMPAAEMIDVHVQIWDAWQRGDRAEARRIFNTLLPLINLLGLIGLRTCKHMLAKRGVFENTNMRIPGSVELDEADERELDAVFEGLKPLLRAKAP